MRGIILVMGMTLFVLPGELQGQQGAWEDFWEDFWRNLQKTRESRDQGLRDWWPNTRRDYERQRDDAAARDDEIVLDLDGLDIPAGRYNVQLPMGMNLRVHVRGAPGDRPRPDVMPAPVYQEVEGIAARMSADLRWLHYGARQLNRQELAIRTQELPALLDALRNAAARRAPQRELHEAFGQFDQTWHRLAFDLRKSDVPNWMQERAAQVSDRDERLHRLLHVGQAPVYDRVRVAALTQYLTRYTRAVVKLDYDPRSPHEAELRRLAQRVHRHAEDLADAVRRNAAHATIVREYEQFDQAWHHLRDRFWAPTDVRPRFRDLMQVMGPIDIALHRELKVQPPVVIERERLEALAAQIENSADHLARDLEYDLKRDPRDLIDAARRLAYAADRLEQRLASTSAHEEARREIDYLLQAWEDFESRVPRNVDDERFGHTLTVYRQLKEDVRQLQTMTS